MTNDTKAVLDVQPECLLLSIPAELRTVIYEYTFATSPGEQDVDLCEPAFPSPAVLCSCRQIYSEAQTIFDEACRSYCQQTKFSITVTGEETIDRVGKIDERYLEAVVTLRLVSPASRTENRATLLANGSWAVKRPSKVVGPEDQLHFVIAGCLDVPRPWNGYYAVRKKLFSAPRSDGKEYQLVHLLPDITDAQLRTAVLAAGRTKLTRTELVTMVDLWLELERLFW